MSFRAYNPETDNLDNQGNDLEPPADGTYTGCELVDAAAFTSKSLQDFVKFEWQLNDGTGYRWTVLQGFKSDAQTAVTWSEVGKLGINPTDIGSLEQLDEVLKQQVGSYYDLAVKTNGQFRNTYINGPSTGTNPVVQQNTEIAQQQPAPVGAPLQQGDLDESGTPIPF